jgi:hypothetical protein
MPRLERIWIKRSKRGPMDPRPSATLIPGRGIEGNANQGGRRQVTLIAAERWAAVVEGLNDAVDPAARRGNLLVAGVDLENSVTASCGSAHAACSSTARRAPASEWTKRIPAFAPRSSRTGEAVRMQRCWTAGRSAWATTSRGRSESPIVA